MFVRFASDSRDSQQIREIHTMFARFAPCSRRIRAVFAPDSHMFARVRKKFIPKSHRFARVHTGFAGFTDANTREMSLPTGFEALRPFGYRHGGGALVGSPNLIGDPPCYPRPVRALAVPYTRGPPYSDKIKAWSHQM